MSITANAIFITLFCRARGFTLYAPVSSSEKLTGARRGPGLHLTGLLNHFLLCVGLVTYLWTLSLFGFFQKQILTTNNVYGRYRKQSSIGKRKAANKDKDWGFLLQETLGQGCKTASQHLSLQRGRCWGNHTPASGALMPWPFQPFMGGEPEMLLCLAGGVKSSPKILTVGSQLEGTERSRGYAQGHFHCLP